MSVGRRRAGRHGERPAQLRPYASAVERLDGYISLVSDRVAQRVTAHGRLDSARAEQHQQALHGYAWLAACGESLRRLADWAEALERESILGEIERLILDIGFAEYLTQAAHGIAMSQDEIARPGLFDTAAPAARLLAHSDVRACVAAGSGAGPRRALVELVVERGLQGLVGCDGQSETVALIRDQFRRFADEKIAGSADRWHRENALIPLEVVEEMAELGAFGLAVPEEYGGPGMDAVSMCAVSEELSRGYLGAGSLGTRAEIACELIRLGGTGAQKRHFLPRIVSGETLPTAVFTEPDHGSDLAGIRTRAVRDGDVYRITGSKTWITHASRSDLMTLLARTGGQDSGYRGLSMFLAEKPRGTEETPLPAAGMSGSEIEVLGYRGMREYELAFDGFEVPAGALLGGEEGNGFKQLMATFESARIQTAARAIGVAQNAFELGLDYAVGRKQFGKRIVEYPRVFGKLAWMAVELMLMRQLTYAAARKRDSGERSDIEAGMAKLMAARAAWSAADNALQIHGGNGYATEYSISRVLCDARILSIFEGAAEIQAQVVARGLLRRRSGD